MNPYDLVVSDWDFTLCNFPGVELGARTKKVLAEVQERGVQIVLASGRPTPGLVGLLRFNEIDLSNLHIVGFNGGTVSHAADPHHNLFFRSLDPVAVRAAIQQADELGLELIVPTPHGIYTSRPNGFITMIEAATADVPAIPLEEWDPEVAPAMKVEFHLQDYKSDDIIPRIDKAIRAAGSAATLSLAGMSLLEVNAAGVNKGTTLEWVYDHLGVASERVLAFGDNHNDMEMLRQAGMGMAVGNAVPELKAVADKVIGDVETEAVAAEISEIFGID